MRNELHDLLEDSIILGQVQDKKSKLKSPSSLLPGIHNQIIPEESTISDSERPRGHHRRHRNRILGSQPVSQIEFSSEKVNPDDNRSFMELRRNSKNDRRTRKRHGLTDTFNQLDREGSLESSKNSSLYH